MLELLLLSYLLSSSRACCPFVYGVRQQKHSVCYMMEKENVRVECRIALSSNEGAVIRKCRGLPLTLDTQGRVEMEKRQNEIWSPESVWRMRTGIKKEGNYITYPCVGHSYIWTDTDISINTKTDINCEQYSGILIFYLMCAHHQNRSFEKLPKKKRHQ